MKDKNLAAFQYKRTLEERRGHYYRYMTDDILLKLEKNSFKCHLFDNGRDETMSEESAKEARQKYKLNGKKAMILCVANKLRIKTFEVWHN